MFWTDDDDFCYKRVQTPGMSPPRAGAWTYCLFTPKDQLFWTKGKVVFNPLRLGTVIVLVSSGIDFVNTPRLYSDRATR